MGIDTQVAGIFAIADPVKATTPTALEALRAEGIEVVMLTGDNRVAAEAVGPTLGIDRVEAEVLPDHKSDVVNRSAPKDASSPWPVTVSTTPPLWQPPTWGWR
jgi:P-type E1-E2 ATPase